jgi:hypothetical protein
MVHYDAYGNRLYLYSHDAGNWLGPAIPGGGSGFPPYLQDSTCKLDALGSSASGGGQNLTLSVRLLFAFSQNLNTYLRGYSAEGIDTGWMLEGAWNATPVPTSAVVTPPGGYSSPVTSTQQGYIAQFPGFLSALQPGSCPNLPPVPAPALWRPGWIQ